MLCSLLESLQAGVPFAAVESTTHSKAFRAGTPPDSQLWPLLYAPSPSQRAAADDTPHTLNHVFHWCQAVGQLTSTASMAHNLLQCQLLVQKAVRAGAKVKIMSEGPRPPGGKMGRGSGADDLRQRPTIGPVPPRSNRLHCRLGRGDGPPGETSSREPLRSRPAGGSPSREVTDPRRHPRTRGRLPQSEEHRLVD